VGGRGDWRNFRLFRQRIDPSAAQVESLEKIEQNFLRDLATSSLQVGEVRQSEVRIEPMGGRVELSSLWLCHGDGSSPNVAVW